MAVANCPSCGGQINFAIGSSAVVICDYCHSVIARTDRGLDAMVVQQVGTAALISGEGEIPWRVMPGDTYDYADLSGAERRFGTIDYSEDTPLLFKGQETTLKELGISINLEPRRQTKV